MNDADHGSDQPAGLRKPAQRPGLREFQDALAERLRNAGASPAQSNRLALRIGATDYLVDLPEAGEIVAVPDIVPVPWTRPWYRGLANVRGNLTGVIDLALFMGTAPTVIDAGSRLLVLAPELGCNAGILVSRMLGLRSPSQWVSEAANGNASDAPWIGARLRDPDGGLWEELHLAILARDERFLHVGVR